MCDPCTAIERDARAACLADGHDPDRMWPYEGHSLAKPHWRWYVSDRAEGDCQMTMRRHGGGGE